MSYYGSQKALNQSGVAYRSGSRGDLSGGMTQQYAQSEVIRGSGNGYEPYMDGYNSFNFSRSSMGDRMTRGMGERVVMSSSGAGGMMMMGGGGSGGGMMMSGGSGMIMTGGGAGMR